MQGYYVLLMKSCLISINLNFNWFFAFALNNRIIPHQLLFESLQISDALFIYFFPITSVVCARGIIPALHSLARASATNKTGCTFINAHNGN
jgi:hypothetical protein